MTREMAKAQRVLDALVRAAGWPNTAGGSVVRKLAAQVLPGWQIEYRQRYHMYEDPAGMSPAPFERPCWRVLGRISKTRSK